MKLNYLLFFVFFVPSSGKAQNFYKPGFFVIKGQVKNFKKSFLEFGLTSYINGNITNFLAVKPDGSFKQKFPIQNRQNIYFQNMAFTISNKDTIFIEWDDTDFKKTFSIKGKNDLRTMELQNQIKLETSFRKPLLDLNRHLSANFNELSTEKKYNLINDLYNKNVQAVLDSSGFFSESINNLITSLYSTYSNMFPLFNVGQEYKLILDSTRTYPNLHIANISSNDTQLNESSFFDVPEYREYFYNYIRLRNLVNLTSKRNASNEEEYNQTLLHQYNWVQSNITSSYIKDLFNTKSIIDDFKQNSFSDVENVYKKFLKTCKTPYLKNKLQKYYTSIKSLKPGNSAPSFSLKNEKGQIVSLSDYKGKVVYIDFWGVSCAPCINDITNFIPDLHNRYKGKEVVFINICIDSKVKQWKYALDKYKLDGINLIAEGFDDNPVCKKYNISSIPHYILIDKNGKIANNNAIPPGLLLQLPTHEIDQLLK
jgi:peroxiredoxin